MFKNALRDITLIAFVAGGSSGGPLGCRERQAGEAFTAGNASGCGEGITVRTRKARGGGVGFRVCTGNAFGALKA